MCCSYSFVACANDQVGWSFILIKLREWCKRTIFLTICWCNSLKCYFDVIKTSESYLKIVDLVETCTGLLVIIGPSISTIL